MAIDFTPGAAPAVRTQGFTIPASSTGPILATPIGGIDYQVRVAPNPFHTGPLSGGAVIVNVSGALSASIGPVPGPTLQGFADATAEIIAPGFSVREFAAVGAPGPGGKSDTTTFQHRLVLTPGAAIDVNLTARGNAVGTWDAMADPVFEFDPDETFEVDGEIIHVADAYVFEYSPDLIVPEPATGTLIASAIGVLALVRRRDSR